MIKRICGRLRRRVFPQLAGLCGALLLLTGAAAEYYAGALPDHFFTQSGRSVSVPALLPVTLHRSADSAPQQAELRLFGVIPVKTVSLTTVGPVSVYVGGEPFGIRMLSSGVMVVSLGAVGTKDGAVSPARDAGIEVGDIIRSVNGIPIRGNADLQAAVGASDGRPVTVSLMRGGTEQSVTVTPAYAAAAKRWQTGMWVRDSTAGIGTVTYYMQAPNGQIRFGGLGHAVCDADTGEQIPLASGDVVAVSVREIVPGTAGKPGELRGSFDLREGTGTLLSNTASGVFGVMDALPQKRMRLPLGTRQDIRRGEAQIFTTLHGTEPEAYTVEIEEIRRNDAAMRDLVLRVTDERLLAEAGGIVQGMSGSPIVQDGRLIGAVTHVFVRDPTRGYGIFAENMYAQTAEVAEAELSQRALPAAGGEQRGEREAVPTA